MSERRSVTYHYFMEKKEKFFDIVISLSNQPGIVDLFFIESTELYTTQVKLQTANNELSLALQIAEIIPWKWDLVKKTIVCDSNKAFSFNNLNLDTEDPIEIPDTHYFAKVCKEDRERVQKAFTALKKGRTDKVKEEYRVLNTDGKHWKIDWVEVHAAVERKDSDGKPLTLLGSSLVITERKKKERELIIAKESAEESNRLKSAFLANMSHEIRTPLNAIVGFSSILEATDDIEEKREYISLIETNNALLLQLISDILDLSKIEAGTLEFIYRTFELNELMRSQESIMQLKLVNGGVKLKLESTLPECWICSDKNRLSQVLSNLLNNAIKFTCNGEITFGYKLQEQENTLYFYVKDTGKGIPPEMKNTIFGRFVKLDSFVQGTGLGLSICQVIVEHLGGKIGVDSVEGEGSTFWFTIPYKAAERLNDETRVLDNFMEEIIIPKEQIKILVAEDNPGSYKLIRSILQNEYQIIHAYDGREAVELFKIHTPHLVLMDIGLPELNGCEATNEIRKISPHVPIVAVTAFAYTTDEQYALENGFDKYMAKPINAERLKQEVLNALKKYVMLV